MPNPFEMLGQFQAFKDQSEILLASHDSAWFLRAGAAKMLELVLTAALDAGPPAAFAADLGLTDDQAAILYARVLRAALLRQRQAVTNGR